MHLVRVLVLMIAACGSNPTPATPISNTRPPGAAPHELVATIERTACFGWCPVYKAAVYRDGTVEYDGDQFAKTKGHATGSLAPAQLAALDELFERHRYLALRDAYTNMDVTDMPSVTTSYAPPGQPAKLVKHYRGDRSAPRELVELEDGIDRIIGIERWIGSDDERRKLTRE